MSKRKKKRKHAEPEAGAVRPKEQTRIPIRTKPMIPVWAITLVWFLAACAFSVALYYLGKDKFGVLWSTVITLILVTSAVGCHIHNDFVAKASKEPSLSGFLTPADEPTPENPCSPHVPPDAMLLLIGNSASYTTHFPHTVIRIKGENVLTVDNEGGRIAVSAKVFSRDGRIVAEIKRNQFFVNPNNYFRIESPDVHSLIVYDQEDRAVLNVRYLNPHTIQFLGILNHPVRPLIISRREGVFRNTVCFGENGTDFNYE